MRNCCCALFLLAGCQSLEDRMVFHPVRTPADAPSPPHPVQDVALHTADGIKLHARWYPHPRAKGVILYCHGNAGNLEYHTRLMRNFHELLDHSALIVDYPGFGRSEGKPSEAGCYAAAEAAYDWLVREQSCHFGRGIVIAGESLGGGVAVDLASKRPHDALVLIRTFTSVPDVARQTVGVMSASTILFNRFDSLKKISTCSAPIFIAQADRDRLIPFGHGEMLRDACRGRARLHVLRGLDHNDPLPADFFRELRGFLETAEADRDRWRRSGQGVN